MSSGFYLAIVGIPLLLHLALAFFASMEVTNYPLFKSRQKVLWQIIVWVIPILGTFLLHKKIKLGWGSGESSNGGDNYTCGGTGTSSGGGDGGGD